MIEVYAFLAMFALQVLVLSVVAPARLVRRIRSFTQRYPADQFPQLYAAGSSIVPSGLSMYRALNWLAAVAGVVLLGWLYTYMRRPDWDDGPIEALVGAYLMVQFVPLLLLGLAGAQTNRRLREAFPENRRTATLRPRRLFDFVSPIAVFLAAFAYVLFVAYALYIDRNPFPGFAGALVNIAMMTALYALMAFVIYRTLFGKKSNPLQTQSGRTIFIGTVVKACVYVCLGSVVFLSANFTLVLFDLQNWEPLALSVGNIAYALLFVSALNAVPGAINLDALRGNDGVPNAATRAT